MARLFYVNMRAREDGLHELHVAGCERLSGTMDRQFLGMFRGGRDAIAEAQLRDVTAIASCLCCRDFEDALDVREQLSDDGSW